ncbi:uncharacterized protein LOC143019240 [Oratosquilla oratoria]|uniref:uncharacterized protein LOC143019240 n=1 Tax=Oratosquilla oratoria TaxID=337810 RepID=UPI003F75FEAF
MKVWALLLLASAAVVHGVEKGKEEKKPAEGQESAVAADEGKGKRAWINPYIGGPGGFGALRPGSPFVQPSSFGHFNSPVAASASSPSFTQLDPRLYQQHQGFNPSFQQGIYSRYTNGFDPKYSQTFSPWMRPFGYFGTGNVNLARYYGLRQFGAGAGQQYNQRWSPNLRADAIVPDQSASNLFPQFSTRPEFRPDIIDTATGSRPGFRPDVIDTAAGSRFRPGAIDTATGSRPGFSPDVIDTATGSRFRPGAIDTATGSRPGFRPDVIDTAAGSRFRPGAIDTAGSRPGFRPDVIDTFSPDVIDSAAGSRFGPDVFDSAAGSRFGSDVFDSAAGSRFGPDVVDSAAGSIFGPDVFDNAAGSRFGPDVVDTTAGSMFGPDVIDSAAGSRFGPDIVDTTAGSRFGSDVFDSAAGSRFGPDVIDTAAGSRFGPDVIDTTAPDTDPRFVPSQFQPGPMGGSFAGKGSTASAHLPNQFQPSSLGGEFGSDGSAGSSPALGPPSGSFQSDPTIDSFGPGSGSGSTLGVPLSTGTPTPTGPIGYPTPSGNLAGFSGSSGFDVSLQSESPFDNQLPAPVPTGLPLGTTRGPEVIGTVADPTLAPGSSPFAGAGLKPNAFDRTVPDWSNIPVSLPRVGLESVDDGQNPDSNKRFPASTKGATVAIFTSGPASAPSSSSISKTNKPVSPSPPSKPISPIPSAGTTYSQGSISSQSISSDNDTSNPSLRTSATKRKVLDKTKELKPSN